MKGGRWTPYLAQTTSVAQLHRPPTGSKTKSPACASLASLALLYAATLAKSTACVSLALGSAVCGHTGQVSGQATKGRFKKC